ncbi:BON domain-containing protein [Acerihabitans sp. KWT182]|uniref:BON domain-containing protein n=1 Tax=Acerihabitans sp. KWT182 TaxID=3157919 RepID=A0AAU7Q5M1_9GAMM
MKTWRHFFAFALSAVLATAVLGCAPTPKSESTGGYIDDTVITTKVKSELLGDEDITSRSIHVDTYKGRVQLSGFVGSAREAGRAVAVARRVPGVREVENHLSIK